MRWGPGEVNAAASMGLFASVVRMRPSVSKPSKAKPGGLINVSWQPTPQAVAFV